MSTTGKEYRLAIRIAGIIDKSFATSLATAKTALRANVKAIDGDFTKLDRGFNKIMGVGTKCFHAIATAAGVAATAIGAATAASIYVGSEFESAFAGVKKTTDATAEEYEQLRQGILAMTGEIPAAATEIAAVMESAGQLGIAKEALLDFTETMINLGVSTNLTSDEAATNLAKFANIMTMDNYGEDGISNYERLGSVVVDLGNKFATTEADIVAASTQLAAAGKLAGMSEADIMGISAAMSSVGLATESGASSMSRLIMQMQQSVSEGGDSLTQYAETAGMTAGEFATLFREDAAGAVVEFIGGLNEAGEDSYGILEDLELSTIRTRKAFLSLAGADDLMANAVGIANEAWDENIALAVEAGKRYETAESRVQLMKNAFTELGIVAYDDLREPFVDTVNSITEGVSGLTEYVGSADGLSKWMRNIETEFPTLQRKFNAYAQPVFGGIKSFGGWIIDHGAGITSAIAGIGAGLGAYKVVSSGAHLVNSLMALAGLNPVTKVLLGVVGAIGLLTGAYVAYKQHEQGLINDNLAAHFGNISLSMEELQAVAEHIISSKDLEGVKEALSAFDDLSTISAEIETSVTDLNKMNWKVSIGMELTEEEKDLYKTTIDNYVKSAEAYVLQSQYAVALNLEFALGKDENGNDLSVADKVNKFYSDSHEEITALGAELNTAVTEAFNDGLLDIKEAEKIAQIQADMAKIQEGLATGEFDAKMSILEMEYAGGGSLTPDSFMNLQSELAKQVESATATYEESYTKAYASIQAAYEAGDYLTETEYQSALQSIQEQFLQNTGAVQARALNFQLETIMGQYQNELDPAIQEYMASVQSTLEKYTELGEGQWSEMPSLYLASMINEISNAGTLNKETQGAISQLLEAMQPAATEMQALKQQYEDIGAEVPQALIDGLTTFDTLNALANSDANSIGTLIGQQMVEGGTFDTFYQDVLSQIDTTEFYIPETITSGISTAVAQMAATEVEAAGNAAVPPAVDGVYALSQSAITNTFLQGFTATTALNLTLQPKIMNLTGVRNFVNSQAANLNPNIQINERATGGLATRPELTWFAEEGPEMAIPIDGSQNAIKLWEQTGRLLGMDSALDGINLEASGSNQTIQYNPTLQFYGEAPSKTDIADALRISQDEFESLMERYLKTQGRVSFA